MPPVPGLDHVFAALSDPTRRAIVARLARGPARVTDMAGRFIRLERPRLIEETWMSESTHGLETLLRVEFEPKGGGTQLTLTHSGLPDDEAENHRKGWEEILSTLDEL